jgi:hypothetical protein
MIAEEANDESTVEKVEPEQSKIKNHTKNIELLK